MRQHFAGAKVATCVLFQGDFGPFDLDFLKRDENNDVTPTDLPMFPSRDLHKCT
jgi:hypothetical protein